MLKPSEAIRQGRSRVPRWTAGLFSFFNKKTGEGQQGSVVREPTPGSMYAACTLGAMAVGYLGREGVIEQNIFNGSFYWPAKFGGLDGAPALEVPCKHGDTTDDAYDTFGVDEIEESENGRATLRVTDIIAHLNDAHSPLAVGRKPLPTEELGRRGMRWFTPAEDNADDVWPENRVVRWLEANGL